jgi:SAM-dependent methyltransferase
MRFGELRPHARTRNTSRRRNPPRGSRRWEATLRELAMQALSSVEGGYDLLAPKFDHTPFRTPGGVLDATAGALRPLGPFGRGLDVCCGTGAGMRVLRSLCQGPVTGIDFSTGMLAQARRPDGSGPTRGRQPAAPACPRAQSQRTESGGYLKPLSMKPQWEGGSASLTRR